MLWFDNLAVAHLSVGVGATGEMATVDGDDEFTFYDLAVLAGVAQNNLVSAVGTGDFIV